ncbi:GFA family protein [Luteimonas pelagia]
MDTGRGSCLCGAVTFDLTWPSKWVAHCHCSLCRRAHGAAFVTWVGMERPRVSIEDPDNALVWHASSDHGERGFCSRCGSTVFFRGSRWPDELHVTLANLHDGADRVPQVHAYWDSHVDWVALDEGDGLPRKPAPL